MPKFSLSRDQPNDMHRYQTCTKSVIEENSSQNCSGTIDQIRVFKSLFFSELVYQEQNGYPDCDSHIQLLCNIGQNVDYKSPTDILITRRLYRFKDNSVKVASNPNKMVQILGIKFAPLVVPLERRLQTFSVLLLVGIFGFFPLVCCLLILYLLLFTNLYFISVGYLAWMFYDINILKTSGRGGRRSDLLRNSHVMRYFRDYFPVKLHKTEELDSNNKNFIIGSHPHGIIGCGTLINFATDATKFSEKYPGIKCYPLTLKLNFKWPILREIILWFGKNYTYFPHLFNSYFCMI